MFILGATNASAQVPTPDTDLSSAKYYRIQNSRSGKYVVAGASQTLQSTTFTGAAAAWVLIADGEQPTDGSIKVKIYNVEKELYLNNPQNSTYNETGTTFYINKTANSGDNVEVSKDASLSGWNNWNDVAHNRIEYYYANDGGSYFSFQEITTEDLSEFYTTSKANAQTIIDGIAAENIKTDLFYYSQEKVDALKDMLTASAPTTVVGYFDALKVLSKTSNTDLLNMPADGSHYYISSSARDNEVAYLGIGFNGELQAYNQKATRSVWQFNKVSNGIYTIKNIHTGRYIEPTTAWYAHWKGVTNAKNVDLIPADGGVFGTTALGVASNNYGKMHQDGNKDAYGNNHIVCWEKGNASNWTLEAYSNEHDEALANAEASLLVNDRAGAHNVSVTELNAYNTMFGVNVAAPSVESFASYDLNFLLTKSYTSDLMELIYAAAANNYYRISSATHSIDEVPAALGLDRAANYPCGVTASAKDVDAVWQFVPSEGGVKIYNPNYDKYIAPVVGTSNPVRDCAKMVDYENGGLFYIEVRDAATNGIRFKGANGNYVNMEGSGNKYVLDSWFESGSYLTLAQATTLDVDIANASIGGAYATAYLPFDVTVPAGDVKAYVGADKGTYIQMTEATAVAAKNGFILEGTAAGNVTLTIGATDAATSEISGTTSAITLDDSNRSNYLLFGIGKESNQLGFYKAGDAITTIAANKAFIDNATSAALPLVFGGETTGIESVETVNANAPMFDLSGRRILAPAKGGIYIQNGKKFIVK